MSSADLALREYWNTGILLCSEVKIYLFIYLPIYRDQAAIIAVKTDLPEDITKFTHHPWLGGGVIPILQKSCISPMYSAV